MGKAAGVAELSLMFGTFQFVYCQPSTLGFPSNWLALLFANEKVIKKNQNYLSIFDLHVPATEMLLLGLVL